MNEAAAAGQHRIFDAPLDKDERDSLDALVARHKANAASTQQLALDASKLVTTSQERLARQAGAGFFKRFAAVVSGKTNADQLANQNDMLRMQKFAWHYLQQLQQQNLINAQSIAVIRNNLGTMNEYIIETRDFLEQAVDKIDRRLRQVENKVSFSDWALNIEANKRRHKSTPKILLILRLTYDFLRTHQDVALTERDIGNHLVTTLEKLDINCDDEIALLDFINDLIDQVDIAGIDHYRGLIELAVDDHIVDGDFIQKNISGLAFNVLYFLSEHYERIAALIGDEKVCDSDAARERIVASFFGQEFPELATRYTIRDLICEIVGASQVAIEVYKDAHGLNAAPEDDAADEPAPEQDIVSLVSSLPDIDAHTFLDTQDSDARRDYVLLLALAVADAASLNKLAQEFIALLGEKAGIAGLGEQVIALTDHPRKQVDHQAAMKSLLDDEDKKYTWLLDAFFLLALAGKPVENAQIRTILGILKPGQLKELLPHMLAILGESDQSRLMDAATALRRHTQGWKNIVRYRTLRFDQCFAPAAASLDSATWAVTKLMMEMYTVHSKGLEHAFYADFSDGSFLGGFTDKAAAAICSQGRKSAHAELNALRSKARDLLSQHSGALSQANGVIARWDMPTFEFDHAIGYGDIELDNAAGNEDWGDQFEHYYSQVDKALEGFNQACTDAAAQIDYFVKGDFDHSIVALRERRRAEARLMEQQQALEKQSAVIVKDGQEHLFGIEWRQVDAPPCNPEDITHLKTDGKVWLIVASIDANERFYRSEDGLRWQEVQLDTPDMKVWIDDISVVNGTWIVRNRSLSSGTRDEGFYYSEDAITWRHRGIPNAATNNALSLNGGRLTYGAITYFDGMWLWSATRYQSYTYVEKGIFSDSTKTDTYPKTAVYCARTLEGPWQPWEHAPQCAEGVEVTAIRALPGSPALLAFCEYSSSYLRKKKKPDAPPFVMYFGPRMTWQQCDWGGRDGFRYGSDLVFSAVGERMLCVRSGEILTSDKGYEWRLQATRLYVDEAFALDGLTLFVSRNSAAVHVTQDASAFKEIALEEGGWSRFGGSARGMLAVYEQNRYEKAVLRLGRYVCTPRMPSDAAA